MKRFLQYVVTLGIIALLSACGPTFDMTDGIIDVQYENIRYEGSSIIVDVFVTNGTEDDYDLEYVEFALYMPDEEQEFCGAGFDIYETVKAGKYNEYEIEFTSEYIFMTQSDLDKENLDVNDLILFFWLE